jgi:Tol biopolymer transport system component
MSRLPLAAPRTPIGLIGLLVLAGPSSLQVLQSTQVAVTITEGTNIAAAVSPDGRTVAIDLLGRIWVVPRAGGAATVLTDELGDARQPTWSHDGSRIAFQSFRDGTWHLWSVAAGGGDLRQHTFGPFDDREPHYTPDGRSIVFASDRSGNYDIWRIDLATGGLERLTDDPGDDFAPAAGPDDAIAFASSRRSAPGIYVRAPDGTASLWSAATGQLAGPGWSPDGQSLAFQVFAAGTSRLMVAARGESPRPISAADDDVFPFRPTWLSADEILYTSDGHVRRIRPTGDRLDPIRFEAKVSFGRPPYRRTSHGFDATAAAPARGLVSPAISPDGGTVAFVALGDLWTVTRGRLTRLTKDPAVQNDPQWSPDGRQLAYVSDQGGSVDLWLWDAAAGTERQLTTNLGGTALPAWSPDGKRIVFHVQRGLGTEIQAIDVGTGAVTTVRANLFDPSRVTFGPDGKLMAVAALKANSAKYREGRNEILLFGEGGPDRWIVPPTGRGIGSRGIDGPSWSPNGRHMAFVMDGLLWAMPVTPGGDPNGPMVRLSTELANTVGWTGDSRSVFYQASEGFRSVSLADGATDSIAVPLTWRRTNPTRRLVVHAPRLWDGVGAEARPDVDVVITGHRITRVVAHSQALHRDSVVDGTGLTVMPGLADAHAHLGFGTGEALGRTWLAYGITTVRDPAADPFRIRERREAVESGVRIGPRELATGRIFDGERIYYGFNNAITAGSQLGQELERAAAFQVDLIKTYVRLPDAIQRRIIQFAHGIGIPVSSHELYPAVAFGADHVEHIRGTSRRGYSPKVTALYRSYQDVIALLTASGMSITPTIGIQGGFFALIGKDPSILDDPRLAAAYGQAYVDGLKRAASSPSPFASTPAMIASQGETVRRVVRGGGRVIAGTDAPIIPYGLSLHTELSHYVDGGLTPVEALRTATSGFARAMGLEDQLGTIAAGRLADLILVEGDPLSRIADARRVKVVIKNGDVFTAERLMAGPIRPAAARLAERP